MNKRLMAFIGLLCTMAIAVVFFTLNSQPKTSIAAASKPSASTPEKVSPPGEITLVVKEVEIISPTPSGKSK